MNSPSIRVVDETPNAMVLAMVELDRWAGVAWRPGLGRVALVDHITAWVFEDGSLLGAVHQRSVVSATGAVQTREVDPPASVGLSSDEQLDILHVTGMRVCPPVEPRSPRWEVVPS